MIVFIYFVKAPIEKMDATPNYHVNRKFSDTTRAKMAAIASTGAAQRTKKCVKCHVLIRDTGKFVNFKTLNS